MDLFGSKLPSLGRISNSTTGSKPFVHGRELSETFKPRDPLPHSAASGGRNLDRSSDSSFSKPRSSDSPATSRTTSRRSRDPYGRTQMTETSRQGAADASRRLDNDYFNEDSLASTKLLHALIAKGTYVIAEYSPSQPTRSSTARPQDEDLSDLCRKVLCRMPRNFNTGGRASRQVYVFASYTFSYIVQGVYVFLCVSKQTAGSDMPFKFLAELRQRSSLFDTSCESSEFGRARESDGMMTKDVEAANEANVGDEGKEKKGFWLSLAYSRSTASGPSGETHKASSKVIQQTKLLKDLVEFYNSEGENWKGSDHPGSDDYPAGRSKGAEAAARINRVERGLEKTTEIMKDNIGKVMQRGEQIESLVNRTAVLRDEMGAFSSASRQLKQRVFWSSYKHVAICIAVSIGMFFLVFSYFTGFNSLGFFLSHLAGSLPFSLSSTS